MANINNYSRIIRSKLPIIFVLFGVVIIILIFYIGSLIIAPNLPMVPFILKSSIDLNTKDDAMDSTNRIQIQKMGIEVPFYTGSEQVLEQGAWHRKPENGNPKDGGNFVLAAHRFEMGVTPSQTRQKSPFYKIDSLQIDDTIRVYYQNQWYDYVVTGKKEVSPTALYIENKTNKPTLTLYSCSLGGAAVGRYVILAEPYTP